MFSRFFPKVTEVAVVEKPEEKYVEPAYMAEARQRAKEYLGTKWVLHPDNAAVKKVVEPNILGRR